MGALRKSLWTIAAITALPTPAAAQGETGICEALGRIVAAGHEQSPFASVARRLGAREPVIPSLGAEQCEVRTGEGLLCAGPATSHFSVGLNRPLEDNE